MLSLGMLKRKPETAERLEERPRWVDQPERTHCGYPIREVPWKLPYVTQSLCPECLKVVTARKFAEDSSVWMEKTCPEHGHFRELLAPDVDVYLDMFSFRFGDGRGVENPTVPDGAQCPQDCGLCNMHHSHTALANVDLTNRCDMTCPVCFANANAAGYVCEPDLAEVRNMLKNLREMRPVPAKVVQFSGGEPTTHPKWFRILEMAREMGFWHIQAATNGKNLSDLSFARRSKEAGLNTLYLQFDGVTDEVQFKTRAENVMETKRRVVENCREVGLRIVLVPTIVKGVNDHQIGDIVRFAAENVDVIVGISFQPVCFTGRINSRKRLEKRYTITHLALDVERQTGWIPSRGGWLPLGCTSPLSRLSEALSGETAMTVTCHPDCGAGAYLFVEPHGRKEVVALTDFFDLRSALIEIQELAEKTRESSQRRGRVFGTHHFSKVKVLNILRKYFRQDRAPTGLTFLRLLRVLDGYKDKKVAHNPEHLTRNAYPTLFVAGMHFQDPYNYDIDRVRRCVIHYSARDGRLYPFCTYNSGPVYRERVETSISVPLETYQRQAECGTAPSQLEEPAVRALPSLKHPA